MAVDERPAPRNRASGGRTVPYNLAAERSLLGAMLTARDAVYSAAEIVQTEHFYLPAHQHIFDAVRAATADGAIPEPVTVAEVLERADLLAQVGGIEALYELQNATPSIANAARYATIIFEHAVLRRLISVAGDIAEIGYSLPDDVPSAVDRAEALMFGVSGNRARDSILPLPQVLGAAYDHIEQLYENGTSITGVPTGFLDVDEILNGLQPGALLVLGARPSMGKCVTWDTPILDPVTGLHTPVEEVYLRAASGEDVHVLALTDAGQLVAVRPSAVLDEGEQPVLEVRTATGRLLRTTGEHPFLTPNGWTKANELQPGDRVATPRDLPWFGIDRISGAEVALLAHLLGHGGLVDVNALEADVVRRGLDLDIDAIGVLQGHGLWHAEADALRVPAAVFRLPRQQVELFVQRLTSVNRTLWLPEDRRLGFTARSDALARDVAHLMRRLGHHVRVVVDEVTIRGTTGPVVRVESIDTDPADEVVDIRWDVVESVEDGGVEQVYDLTVPRHHTFVAADVVVHNTAFALSLASHVATKVKRPVLFFSLEMGHRELAQRLLALESEVDASKLRNGRLNESDWEKLSRGLGRLEGEMWIDDDPMVSVMEIRGQARRLKAQHGELGLVVVDYLQLMSGRGSAESRQVEIAEISRGLKLLARELSVPVVALSQLSRNLESRADKRPVLSDLRESGSIEQDADVVMFLYRDDYYNPDTKDRDVAELIIAKHRAGPTGTVRLVWAPRFTKFRPIAKGI
jgi:replicative DNA helicase